MRNASVTPQRSAARSAAGRKPWKKNGWQGTGRRSTGTADNDSAGRSGSRKGKSKSGADHQILHQEYFKSVGPRVYAAQIKQASNGNHYLVITEGQRDEADREPRKTRIFVYSEDFVSFFKMLKQMAEFIKANPVSPEVANRQAAYWAKQSAKPSHEKSGVSSSNE